MDNLYRVQAASPELAALMRRLKTIYAITGGEVPKSAGGKMGFNEKKSVLIAQLSNFDKLLDSRDHSGLSSDSRDYIRLKITINTELNKLEGQLKDLIETNKKEVEKKKSGLSGEEIAARNDVMQAVMGEFHAAFKAAKGMSHVGAEENQGAGVGMRVISKDALMKGQFAGAGIKTKKEEMSQAQMQVLAEIEQNTREQDSVLEEIGKGVDELKDLAEKMHDEFVIQDKMLSDLESKADKTQTKIDGVNDRMKDAITKLNDKSTNMCIYLICCVMLLGLGVVAYNVAKKNGQVP